MAVHFPSGLCIARPPPPPPPPRPPRPPARPPPAGTLVRTSVTVDVAGLSDIVRPPAEKRRFPSSAHCGPDASTPSALTRFAALDASDATSQTSLVLPFVASTRVLTVNATHLP